MELADWVSDWFGVAGTVSGVIGTIVAVWAIKSANRIADRSGAYDRPKLLLSIGPFQVNPDEHHKIVYGFPFESNQRQIMTIPIGIGNAGEKDLSDISVMLRYRRVHQLAVSDDIIGISDLPAGHVVRSYREDEHFSHVTYRISNINPEVRVRLEDPITISSDTVAHPEVSAKTSDNVKVRVNVRIFWMMEVLVTVVAKDQSPVNMELTIGAFKANSIDDLIRTYTKEMRGEIPPGIWRRLLSILSTTLGMPSVEESAFLVYPKIVMTHIVRHEGKEVPLVQSSSQDGEIRLSRFQPDTHNVTIERSIQTPPRN
jgi:hypothetical protein